ncbi:unnamed protein product, partial [Mesorhabditis spiculigera]
MLHDMEVVGSERAREDHDPDPVNEVLESLLAKVEIEAETSGETSNELTISMVAIDEKMAVEAKALDTSASDVPKADRDMSDANSTPQGSNTSLFQNLDTDTSGIIKHALAGGEAVLEDPISCDLQNLATNTTVVVDQAVADVEGSDSDDPESASADFNSVPKQPVGDVEAPIENKEPRTITDRPVTDGSPILKKGGVADLHNVGLVGKPVAAVQGSDSKKGLQQAILDRISSIEAETLCFVCRQPSNDGNQLQRCQPPQGSCSTRFHHDCLKEYNGGNYESNFLWHMNRGLPCCPLHHCHACFLERKKTSAITLQGERIIECAKCYLAFHDCCRPAGQRINEEEIAKQSANKPYWKLRNHVKLYGLDIPKEKLADYCLCQRHVLPSAQKIIQKPNWTNTYPSCSECHENPCPPMHDCATCLAKYHDSCHDSNNRGPAGKFICDTCTFAEPFRIGDYVMAYFQGEKEKWWHAQVIDPDSMPNIRAKFSDWKGHPGYLAVRWCFFPNLMSVVPVAYCFKYNGQRLMRVFDKDTRDERVQTEKREIPHYRKTLNALLHRKPTHKRIDASIYHSADARRAEPIDEWRCGCEKDADGTRCGPNSLCKNRVVDQECGQDCDSCLNRELAQKYFCPDIEVRHTEEKGMGLFATAQLPPGILIGEYAGEIIGDREEITRRQQEATRFGNDEETHYMMHIDKVRIVDACFKSNDARFINHSCDPNCEVSLKQVQVSKTGDHVPLFDVRPFVRTIKPIAVGEELTFSYDMTPYEGGGNLPECFCRVAHCSGRMGGKRKEPKKVSVRMVCDSSSPERVRKRPRTSSQDLFSDDVAKENMKPSTSKKRGRPPGTSAKKQKRSTNDI